MNNKCEICNLAFVEGESNPYVCQEFFKNEKFSIVYMFDEKLLMAIPLEYIDPKTKKHNELREEMKTQLFKASYEFFASVEFHMHWGCPEQDAIDLAGVKESPCRLCAVSHKIEHNGKCGHDFRNENRVILENEQFLQKLIKIGVIEDE